MRVNIGGELKRGSPASDGVGMVGKLEKKGWMAA